MSNQQHAELDNIEAINRTVGGDDSMPHPQPQQSTPTAADPVLQGEGEEELAAEANMPAALPNTQAPADATGQAPAGQVAATGAPETGPAPAQPPQQPAQPSSARPVRPLGGQATGAALIRTHQAARIEPGLDQDQGTQRHTASHGPGPLTQARPTSNARDVATLVEALKQRCAEQIGEPGVHPSIPQAQWTTYLLAKNTATALFLDAIPDLMHETALERYVLDRAQITTIDAFFDWANRTLAAPSEADALSVALANMRQGASETTSAFVFRYATNAAALRTASGSAQDLALGFGERLRDGPVKDYFRRTYETLTLLHRTERPSWNTMAELDVRRIALEAERRCAGQTRAEAAPQRDPVRAAKRAYSGRESFGSSPDFHSAKRSGGRDRPAEGSAANIPVGPGENDGCISHGHRGFSTHTNQGCRSCFNCGGKGHRSRNCPQRRSDQRDTGDRREQQRDRPRQPEGKLPHEQHRL